MNSKEILHELCGENVKIVIRPKSPIGGFRKPNIILLPITTGMRMVHIVIHESFHLRRCQRGEKYYQVTGKTLHQKTQEEWWVKYESTLWVRENIQRLDFDLMEFNLWSDFCFGTYLFGLGEELRQAYLNMALGSEIQDVLLWKLQETTGVTEDEISTCLRFVDEFYKFIPNSNELDKSVYFSDFIEWKLSQIKKGL